MKATWMIEVEVGEFCEDWYDLKPVYTEHQGERRWCSDWFYVWESEESPTGFAGASFSIPSTECQGTVHDVNYEPIKVWSVEPREVKRVEYVVA